MEYMQAKLAAYDGPDPADDLRVGGACFCRWGDRWYGAKILSLDGDSYRVHFLGWGKRHDGTYPATAAARVACGPRVDATSSSHVRRVAPKWRGFRRLLRRERKGPAATAREHTGVYLDLGLRVVDWYASAAMITAKMPRFCLCAASSKRPSCWIRIALTRKKLQVTAAAYVHLLHELDPRVLGVADDERDDVDRQAEQAHDAHERQDTVVVLERLVDEVLVEPPLGGEEERAGVERLRDLLEPVDLGPALCARVRRRRRVRAATARRRGGAAENRVRGGAMAGIRACVCVRQFRRPCSFCLLGARDEPCRGDDSHRLRCDNKARAAAQPA